MKKKIVTSVLLSTFLLAGCQNNVEAPSNDTNDGSTEEVEEQPDETNQEEEVPEEDEENEEAEDGEAAFEYQIDPASFSVVPLDSDSDTEEKVALLTFDDAPDQHALEIAESLVEKDVSAIFFVNGMYMEDDEGLETIRQIHEMGFEIGNHTQTHEDLNAISEEKQKEEIMRTNELIEEATGEAPRFFRPPFGSMSDYAKDLLKELDMTWMTWTFGYDWEAEYQDADALAEITLTNEFLRDGANILMHDREWTAAAVTDIVDGLIEQGYTIVDPALIISGNED